jgi:hypothetical protein
MVEITTDNYKNLRPSMASGDMILFQGDQPASRAIRLFTKNMLHKKGINYEDGDPRYDVNHVAMVIRLAELGGEEHRVFITEAVLPETRLVTLSKKLKSYEGRLFWVPLKDTFNPLRNAIGHEALEMLGVPYDKWGVFQSMAGHVTCQEDSLFCSEYYLLSIWKVLTPGHRAYEALYPGEIILLNYHDTVKLTQIGKEG